MTPPHLSVIEHLLSSELAMATEPGESIHLDPSVTSSWPFERSAASAGTHVPIPDTSCPTRRPSRVSPHAARSGFGAWPVRSLCRAMRIGRVWGFGGVGGVDWHRHSALGCTEFEAMNHRLGKGCLSIW